ncbi:MAG: hypothetical protein ACJ8CR_07390, partial [Roseiflexaceae bacterium]
MSKLITEAAQWTPDQLTDLLRAQGTLPQGRVIAVQAETSETQQAQIGHLTLAYSLDAPPDVPRRLFSKLSRHDRGYPGYAAFAGSEVMFYTVFAPAIDTPPLVRCYAAHYDPLSRRSHLLLEDIAETHAAPRFPDEWPLPPAYTQMEQIVDALVQCQAVCWDHPQLGDLPGG